MRRFIGGALLAAGYILSPLSWWNDIVVNVPISYFAAWLMSLLSRALFPYAFVGAYWFTNVIGLAMMHRGAHFVLEKKRVQRYSRKEFVEDLLIAVGYTLLIVILIKLGVLKPLDRYLPQTA